GGTPAKSNKRIDRCDDQDRDALVRTRCVVWHDQESAARSAVARKPPHVLASLQPVSSAVWRHLIRAGAAKGLARKQIAPAFMALARRSSSGKAVIKMNGTIWPLARIAADKSRPLMADICT